MGATKDAKTDTTRPERESKPPIKKGALELSSSAFKAGEYIPAKFSGDGTDCSPPLKWAGAPDGIKSFALICDDPDAPAGTCVHWVIYAIPSATPELPEALPKTDSVLGGVKQGVNDFGNVGYGGPAPPKRSDHRYFFKLYALDTELTLKARASKADLEKAMKGHIVAEAQLMGRYKR